jgi:hypothetical protein
MCRTGGRRCPGGYSSTRANMAARQRLSRARRALTTAQTSGESAAIKGAAQRLLEARAAVNQSIDSHESGCPRGDVTARDYSAGRPGALVLPAEEPVDVRRLSGQTAYTDLLTFSDGSRVVRKDHSRMKHSGEDDLAAFSDAEELAPRVLGAVGLRPAKVRRTGPDEIHIEYVDGQSGEDLTPWGRDISTEVRDSDDGRAMGLADHLLANADRNPGNWIRTDDGRLVGIDHGSAFWQTDATSSPFARTDYTRSELDQAGARLEALRPEFEHLGRGDWHEAMTGRLHSLFKASQEGT